MSDGTVGQTRIDGSEVTPEEALAKVSASEVRIDVDADFSDWLKANDVWPDGIPEGVWTAETLAKDIGERHHTAESFLADWDLELAIDVTIIDDQGRTAKVVFGHR
jgi:hypothetical protein